MRQKELPYLNYQETVTKRGIKATLRLEMVRQGAMPSGYEAAGKYHIVTSYESAKGVELTEEQNVRGRALTRKLEETLEKQIQEAGWRLVRRVSDYEPLVGRDGSRIWEYQPSAPLDPRGKVVPRGKHLEMTYVGRKVQSCTITFCCAICNQEVTEEHFPGQKPRYCANEQCQKEANRLRVVRSRERKKKQAEA